MSDNNSRTPKIDILMATHNGEDYIAEQISSLQNQTFENWTLLISDDCSQDSTMSIIEKMQKEDPRIKVVSTGKKHGSAKANFMNLLKFSKSEYAMFCDQDDFWMPTKIEKSLDGMINLEAEKGKKRPLLVYTDLRVVDKSLCTISDSFFSYAHRQVPLELPYALVANSIPGCTMLFNSRARDLASRIADPSQIIMHDWWLALVTLVYGDALMLTDATILYRQHGSNESGADRFKLSKALRQYSFRASKEEWLLKFAQAQNVLAISENEPDANRQSEIETFANLLHMNRMSRMRFLAKNKIKPNRLWEKIYAYVICFVL